MSNRVDRAVRRIQSDVDAFFRVADVNRSGKLSRTELRKALAAPEFALSAPDIDKLVATFDVNGDYVIEMQELRATLDRLCAETESAECGGTALEVAVFGMRRDPRAFFQQADQNGSGKLSRQELSEALAKENLGLAPGDIQAILEGMEFNVDKVINVNDFIDALEKFKKPVRKEF